MRTTTYFVSRHHEHPPATLEDLLRTSAKGNASVKKADKADAARESDAAEADDSDSDSDFECGYDTDSADDRVCSEPEVDEGRLHSTEPREGLYLDEMRRQRGRMSEKEAQWVHWYVKAQRTWKARTGHSIDEFRIPAFQSKSHSVKRNRSLKLVPCEQEEDDEEVNVSVLVGITRIEVVLLLAAIVFVCLSIGIQLKGSFTSE